MYSYCKLSQSLDDQLGKHWNKLYKYCLWDDLFRVYIISVSFHVRLATIS